MWIACADGCAEKNQWVCKGDLRGHEFVEKFLRGHESGVEELVQIRCCNCGGLAEIPYAEWQQIIEDDVRNSSRRKAGLTRYPYVEPQSGILVHSAQHRDEVWKQLGWHKAENGPDESTFTETDYAIKERYKPREPGWRNLARKMGA